MSGRFLLAGILLALCGCAEPELTSEALQALEARALALAGSLQEQSVAQPGEVVVRLKFDENVDLDLYVTDPLLETVYFARHESRTGGVIGKDARCDSTALVTGPRIEEVRFAQPWPGRYRVGVDFPARCDGSSTRAPAPYAISVIANDTVHETHGLVNLEFFEVVVLEFEVQESQHSHGGS